MIYFLQSGVAGPIKIGTTAKGGSRVKDLQTACPYPARLLAQIEGDRSLEKRIHRALVGDCSNGEWFRPTERVAALTLAARDSTEAVLRCLADLEARRAAELQALNNLEPIILLLFAASLNRLVDLHSVSKVARAADLSEDSLLRLRKAEASTGITHYCFLKATYPDAFTAMDALLFQSSPVETVERLKGVTTLETARDAIDAQLARLKPVSVA